MSDISTSTPTVHDLIAEYWRTLPDRYDKSMATLQLLHDLKENYPQQWNDYIFQAEFDVVRQALTQLEHLSRKRDRLQLHRDAVESRAAAIASTGHVGDARYAVREGVFAALRSMSLAEVVAQKDHCRLVAAGAVSQAQRWDTIAKRMTDLQCTQVGECWSDEELDALWA